MQLGLNALALTALCLMSAVSNTSAASRNTASWHQVADSVQIRLPSGWRIAAQKQVAGHEKERKEIDAQVGLQPKVEPRDAVTFQAESLKVRTRSSLA